MKFRASFSILSLWERGDYENFVKQYFHLEKSRTTREMFEGKEWHKKWEEEIKKTQKLPTLFGDLKLSNPIVETKKVVQVEDWLDFVFICDCYQDNGEFIDFKTGMTITGHEIQLGTQAVGLTLSKIKANKGHIYQYNQYTKDIRHDIVWITDKILESSLNWIETLSSDAHNYLLNNGLYTRFGNTT